mgnify:FL=1
MRVTWGCRQKMLPHRINIKYFVENPAAVDMARFTSLFHRWIQNHIVEGLLIDVADYKHVHKGPGIILIGHEGDYAMDVGGGRPGLLYTRKREMNGDLPYQLRTVFHLALTACHLLEAEPCLEGQITFLTGEAELTFLDRLRTPNEPATFDALHESVRGVVGELYGDLDIGLESINEDPGQCFAIRITTLCAPDLATLIGRLET